MKDFPDRPERPADLLEASLARIWADHGDGAFGIITSWCVEDGTRAPPLGDLKKQVKDLGFGYVPIDGIGQRERNGRLVPATEPALLVKNSKAGGAPPASSQDFVDLLSQFASKFEQRGLVVHHPEDGTQLIALKGDDGNAATPTVISRMQEFDPFETALFFSEMKVERFTLEGFKYANRPQNFMHGMILEAQGEVDIFRRESAESWRKKMNKQ